MRDVTALLTIGSRFVGAVPSFPVADPWWANVEEVNAHLARVLGQPTTVLRLVSASGEGGRDGAVAYQVEVADLPHPTAVRAAPAYEVTDAPQRMPWARPGGPAGLLAWADRHVRRTGPAVQTRTWNLACILRVPTTTGTVWVKALPPFATDEAAAIRMVAVHCPPLVPTVVAAEPGRLLLGDVPGEDGWDPTPELVDLVVPRWVAAQAALAGPPRLPVRPLAMEHDFGLPLTLVHGDFHPGNWRSTGVVLDYADAHWGHPALDAARLLEFTDRAAHPLITQVWRDAWLAHRPGSDPLAALAVARILCHRLNALRYQEFLDNIEEAERVYHEGDPAYELARADALARSA